MVDIFGADSVITASDTGDLSAVAKHWAGVARSRLLERAEASARRLAERAGSDLTSLGIGPRALERLSKAPVLRIRLPREGAGSGHWHELPWELLLDMGFRARGLGSPAVIRHLNGAPAREAGGADAWKRLLYVTGREEARGREDNGRQAVEGWLQPSQVSRWDGRDLRELRRTLKAQQPGILHLSDGVWHGGWDARHGERMDLVRIAAAVNTADSNPALAVCALPWRGVEAARQLVECGSNAAWAPTQGIDDAERIRWLLRLYQMLRLSRGKPEEAFVATVAGLRRSGHSMSAVQAVLYSRGVCQLAGTGSRRSSRARRLWERAAGERVAPLGGEAGAPNQALWVDCQPVKEVNYALLHNNRSLFRVFRAGTVQPGDVDAVTVEVVLDLGAGEARYRDDVRFADGVADLRPQARIPLVSYAAQTIHERIHTTLTVRLCRERSPVYHRAFRVSLLPSDEWRDDDAERNWLPSFVFPRDKAVAEIIAAAQAYRTVLADSAGAGFAGYQGPDAASAAHRTPVDDQVQALWWALILNHPLSYINPPPTYTALSQRLRPPSEVLAYGRGTCIDLSLLLVACLEYVDIYPVVFLLKGHAFPGYCRSEAAYARLRALLENPAFEVTERGTPPDPPLGPLEPWVLDRRHFSGIVRLVRNGDLVPVETVWITRRLGFSDAVREGAANLRVRDEFDALIDILCARRNGVTPLPFFKESAR